ncbi:flavin monoamine oxidase family protein [Ekhidna sp.]
MGKKQSDIIIIGAGLTGLTLAHLLRDTDFQIQILEARSRIGGRIQTYQASGKTTLEMGATWFGNKHTELNSLIDSLNIDIFEQHIGEYAFYEPNSISSPQLVKLPKNNDDSSYRIKNGTSTIVNKLKESLGTNVELQTNEHVKSIKLEGKEIRVGSSTQDYIAKFVVSTIPPNLLLNSVSLNPAIPTHIAMIMKQTHTWMGESIKVGLTYKKPFWKESSGTIFSNVGPIPEMYDHSHFEESLFALKGFVNPAYFSITREERIKIIIDQLSKFYGDHAKDYISYEEKVWRNDPLTYSSYSHDIYPHQNNGDPIYLEPILDGRFFIAGSETSSQFPGYMEGAVQSANYLASTFRNLMS